MFRSLLLNKRKRIPMLLAQLDQLGKASEWSQAGGILGLVIFALFFLLGSFITAVLWRFIKAEDKRQEFFERLMGQHEKERESWRDITNECNATIQANTKAFDDFKDELSDMSHKIIGALTRNG